MTITNPILVDLIEIFNFMKTWMSSIVVAYFTNTILSVAFAIFVVKRVSKLFDIIR